VAAGVVCFGHVELRAYAAHTFFSWVLGRRSCGKFTLFATLFSLDVLLMLNL
jgi:hypothetical protein